MMETDSNLVYSINFSKYSFTNNKYKRHKLALRSIPPIALYGVYRMEHARKALPLPAILAGDLIFIQNLSLYGDFVFSPESEFTFVMREEWNSRIQDLSFFYGNKRKPKFRPASILVLRKQISSIIYSDLEFFSKVICTYSILANFFSESLFRVAFIFIRFIPTSRHKKLRCAKAIYFRYFNHDWMQIENMELFLKRIVYPKLG